MKRRVADRIAAGTLVLLFLAGLYGTWSAYRRRQAPDGMMGSMMGRSMGGEYGMDPLWYVLATVVTVVVIAGVYVAVRDEITDAADPEQTALSSPDGSQSTAAAGDTADPELEESATGKRAKPGRRALDMLPEDERRVLKPVIASPGITQIELRDRSEFSKSKVSQTVSVLEKRGLLYRERQGRTYRVYPDESIAEE